MHYLQIGEFAWHKNFKWKVWKKIKKVIYFKVSKKFTVNHKSYYMIFSIHGANMKSFEKEAVIFIR